MTTRRSGNVRCYARIRPREEDQREEECLHVNSERRQVTVQSRRETHRYSFDRVFDEEDSQSKVYKEAVAPLVADFVSGRNCAIVAYGERGSGKSFTILGRQDSLTGSESENDATHADDRSTVSSLSGGGVSEVVKPTDASTSPFTPVGSKHDPPDQVFASKRTAHPSFSTGTYNKVERSTLRTAQTGRKQDSILHDDSGIAFRVAHQAFGIMERKRRRGDTGENPVLRCSVAAVYCDNLIDLLDDRSSELRSIEDARRQHEERGGADVGTLDEKVCACQEDVARCIEESLLCRQECLRNLHLDESSTHLVVIFKLERFSKSRGKRTISYFYISDLVNSELVRKPPREGAPNAIREAKETKRSLGALRKCLHGLAMNDRSVVIPVKDSALTHLMRFALLRGAGLCLVVAARPNASHLEATMSAMRLGTYVGGLPVTYPDAKANEVAGSQRTRSTSSSMRQRRQHGDHERARDGESTLYPRSTTDSDMDREMRSLRKQLQELRDQNRDLRQSYTVQEAELEQARNELKALPKMLKMAQEQSYSNRKFDDKETAGTFATSTTCGMDQSIGTCSITALRQLALGDLNGKKAYFENVELGLVPVRVCLRLRPLTKLETSRRSRSCIEVHEDSREFTVDSPLDGEFEFCFDQVFGSEASQTEVYESVGVPIVSDVLAGINSSLLVYGLSGTGKKHTLLGTLPNGPGGEDDGRGVAPRIIGGLFDQITQAPETVEFKITCSFVAVFLEKIYDLVEPQNDRVLAVTDTGNGVHVEGCSEAFCFDAEDVMSLLRRGTACQAVIGSKLGIDTKRSHSVFTLGVEQRHRASGEVRRARLQLCQLAGFEVMSKPKGHGQGAQETKIQHRSFAALGSVIRALTEGGDPCTIYNESKLTSILKDSIGGNCKTTVLITASPSSYNISETINTIRFGQHIRMVTNSPSSYRELSMEQHRMELRVIESRHSELTRLVKLVDKELTGVEKRGPIDAEKLLNGPQWRRIRSLIRSKGPENGRNLVGKSDPSGRRDSSCHNRAESRLTDIQSEAVVLRRQNDLLVHDKRRTDTELTEALRENRRLSMENSQLVNRLGLAESRARESVEFLRYMRSLCWRLRKDVWQGRPIEITDITAGLSGAPDLSGLIDLDRMMMDAGFILTTEMALEDIEDEFFGYLLETGLIIDESRVTQEEEFDELSGLDDGIRNGMPREDANTSRWQGMRPPQHHRRPNAARSSLQPDNQSSKLPFRMQVNVVPWLRASLGPGTRENQQQENDSVAVSRYTSREWELKCDLHNMSDKCVDLQLRLNDQTQLVESLMNRNGSLQKKRLAKDAVSLRKERDQMIHNAKAATWKLQELHVVNKLLIKQVEESKQQVAFLEDGFQKLQDSLRSAVHESLESEAILEERLRGLQNIVDSLTGFGGEELDDTSGRQNRVFLLVRGAGEDPWLERPALVDPSSSDSMAKSLTTNPRLKAVQKTPTFFVRSNAKHVRRSRRTGTALAGSYKNALLRAWRLGAQLVPPQYDWMDHDESSFF